MAIDGGTRAYERAARSRGRLPRTRPAFRTSVAARNTHRRPTSSWPTRRCVERTTNSTTPSRCRRSTARRDLSSSTWRRSGGPRVSCRTTTRRTGAELAEEQRLAYVALSRAEDSLLITWSRGRNDPRYPDRAPSRFLAPIESGHRHDRTARNAPFTGDARRARLAAIRAELESSDALAPSERPRTLR